MTSDLATRYSVHPSHSWIELSEEPGLFCTTCCAYHDESDGSASRECEGDT